MNVLGLRAVCIGTLSTILCTLYSKEFFFLKNESNKQSIDLICTAVFSGTRSTLRNF